MSSGSFFGRAVRFVKTVAQGTCFVYDTGGRVGKTAPISRGLKLLLPD